MLKLPNICNPFDMTTNNPDQEKMLSNSERKQESATKIDVDEIRELHFLTSKTGGAGDFIMS